MSQYAYAKDNRSDEKYKADIENGIANQRIVMESYISEKLHIDNERGWDFIENVDKQFSRNWGNYQPDYVLVNPYTPEPVACEVKTQMKPLGEVIYLKKNQIDALVQVNGLVLYATPFRYFMLSARTWQTLEPESAACFGGKPAYKMWTDEAPWHTWRYPLVTLAGYEV